MTNTDSTLIESINEALMSVIGTINGLLWGQVLVYLLVGVGVYFTVRLGFIQLRQLGHSVKILRSGQEIENGKIGRAHV